MGATKVISVVLVALLVGVTTALLVGSIFSKFNRMQRALHEHQGHAKTTQPPPIPPEQNAKLDNYIAQVQKDYSLLQNPHNMVSSQHANEESAIRKTKAILNNDKGRNSVRALKRHKWPTKLQKKTQEASTKQQRLPIPEGLYDNFPPPKPDDVDAVVFWADALHPRWESTYNDLAYKEGRLYDRERYETVDELRYCLRCLSHNAPWLRRIVVVTTFGDAPAFLDPVKAAEAHPPIHIYGNADVLPDGMQVSFNSNALQLSTDQLPNLAPWVALLDDDCYVTAPTKKSDLLSQNGNLPFIAGSRKDTDVRTDPPPILPGLQALKKDYLPSTFAVQYTSSPKPTTPQYFKQYLQNPLSVPVWSTFLNNNYTYLFKSLPVATSQWIKRDHNYRGHKLPSHQIMVLPRAAWKLARQSEPFGSMMRETQRSLFRDRTDVTWWALIEWSFYGGFSVRRPASQQDSRYFNWPTKSSRQSLLQKGVPKHVQFVCVNNFDGTQPQELEQALQALAPKEWCEWEREDYEVVY